MKPVVAEEGKVSVTIVLRNSPLRTAVHTHHDFESQAFDDLNDEKEK